MNVVVLPAEIDLASAPAVTETLIFALSTRPAVIVADLTGTIYCDCAAIRSLCHAARYAAAHGTDLRWPRPPRPPADRPRPRASPVPSHRQRAHQPPVRPLP
jgi:hypothetical protein